ncbi:MAG: imidazole glycerol phosphate synthase subunit HisH [Acidobacteriaceae bacterium]|nr:imidazole glycerol phosphate synthase subunit HisH [Acidobacteriaceae bacterium]MBV9499031.1 imidazole glycerol phosphate synthase subunit HisH [Acidobacteriaceae bacterium]
MTTIVDYGAGNLRSVQNTLDELGASYRVTNKPEAVRSASKLILPGVGHFGQMMHAIEKLGLREPLIERIESGVSFLGICIGLQCLFENSEEAPGNRGLGIFSGTIKRFVGSVRIPHMGWNSLMKTKPTKLLRGLDDETFTYFAHSYYAPVIDATAATCTYMHPYTAVLERDNVHGVQFHPEKSGPVGLHVMRNFLEI